MLTFTTETLKDNTVSINGTIIGKVTDDEARYIISLIKGAVAQKPVQSTEPQKYIYKSDVKTEYSIEKVESLYIIKSGIYYKARTARALANKHIKSLSGITEIELPRANGQGKYKAWGFKTRKAAEEALKTLPTVLTVDELNKTE